MDGLAQRRKLRLLFRRERAANVDVLLFDSGKRVRGLFSFLARLDQNLMTVGMDLLLYAAGRLGEADAVTCFAGQVPSFHGVAFPHR